MDADSNLRSRQRAITYSLIAAYRLETPHPTYPPVPRCVRVPRALSSLSPSPMCSPRLGHLFPATPRSAAGSPADSEAESPLTTLSSGFVQVAVHLPGCRDVTAGAYVGGSGSFARAS